MPTYDYECTLCGLRFERFHGMTETIEVFCPLCSGKAKKCISSITGFILKGSGFYVNDYKKKEKDEKREKANNGQKKPAD
ncbi:zinc ribbon domain-containing protein [candidate division WOR-3 bacterium]|nr:zinc ribbon domain-containing protein [candidate division WOR-3 bacterium]